MTKKLPQATISKELDQFVDKILAFRPPMKVRKIKEELITLKKAAD